VADLLNFSRQQEVLAQDIDINDLISSVIEMVENQSIFESLNFVKYLAPDLPIIQADPAQLKQVFVNLFNNAAEAMGNGGTITLSTRPIDSSFIEIKVSDTGCGIPEGSLGKLFTPFFTTKALGKGTGLGLSIVYGIIKMHKGQITVQSQVAGMASQPSGTTFTITLPVKMQRGSPALVGAWAEVLV
jgi:two-component system NtrC family sensor kinase